MKPLPCYIKEFKGSVRYSYQNVREGVACAILKDGFIPCHPERERRIFALSKAEKILRRIAPQNDKGERALRVDTEGRVHSMSS